MSVQGRPVSLPWILDHGPLHGLLSVIAFQLMQVVARETVYFCSECKNPFVRYGGSNLERKPRDDQDRFCERCGRPAVLRRADRRREEKKAWAKRMYTQGLTIAQITEQLSIKN